MIFFLAGFAIWFYARLRLRQTKRVFIADYQHGVRYAKGIFADVLEPGSYNSYTPKEQITVVDMRPQPFVIERFFYKDVLQSPSVISIGGKLSVSDPYEAVTALKDQVNESIAIIREALRATVSRGIADPTIESRNRITLEIEAAANAELNESGLRVTDLEITELWSLPALPHMSAGTN
jgi:hypothetical protein